MSTTAQPVFHLGITKNDLNGATIAIIPGAPERVEKIAQQMENPRFLAQHREYTIYTATLDGKTVVICSTGIGGPSVSIAVEELAQLGIRTFLRVGTTGAIQPHLNIGDMVVTTASVRLDGASSHFAPMEYPAVADFAATTALKTTADTLGLPVHTGITASSDTFYPGQERYDTYCGRVTKHFQGSMDEWQALNVLNFEMETATLFTMCSSMGLQAGCVAGVIVNRTQNETPDHSKAVNAETHSIQVVVEAARALL